MSEIIEIDKIGKEWIVISAGVVMYSSRNYVKASGVFEYLDGLRGAGGPLAIIEKDKLGLSTDDVK